MSFEKNLFGSDIVVIYYLCNTWVVNLQQILQPYCAVLNELCIPKNLYAKLSFSRVLKRSLCAHWMQVKLFLILLIWTADCTQFLSENHLQGCRILDGSDSVQIFYIRIWTEFQFSAHP